MNNLLKIYSFFKNNSNNIYLVTKIGKLNISNVQNIKTNKIYRSFLLKKFNYEFLKINDSNNLYIYHSDLEIYNNLESNFKNYKDNILIKNIYYFTMYKNNHLNTISFKICNIENINENDFIIGEIHNEIGKYILNHQVSIKNSYSFQRINFNYSILIIFIFNVFLFLINVLPGPFNFQIINSRVINKNFIQQKDF